MIRFRNVAPMAALPLLAVLLAACGGGSTPSVAASPTAPASTQPSPAASGGPAPGASGTIAAVLGSSLEVQSPSIGQVTVNFSSTTRIDRVVTGSISLLRAGDCVTVSGTPATTGGFTAARVTITVPSAAGATSCTSRPAAGAGGGFGFRAHRSPPPTARRRSFTALIGSVTTVSSSGFVVTGVERSGFPASPAAAPESKSYPVTVSAATVFNEAVPATAQALAVGQCVTAIGTTSDTGSVTARVMSVSAPGPDGCTRAGGFGGGFGGSGAAGSGSGGSNA
jgi:hypothetical protein